MKNRVVSFHYVLHNDSGEMLDSSEGSDPLSYVEGQQQIIPGLEEALKPLNLGDKKKVTVTPDKAYGVYDKSLIAKIDKKEFPTDEELAVGDQFRLSLPGKQPRIYTVTEIGGDTVQLDGNHPLAGQTLHFDVEVTEAREATEEDLEADDDCCGHDHDHDHDHHH